MLKIQKLIPEAQIPSRATTGSVGYDLYSTGDYIIPPNSRAVISTGVAIKLPPQTYGRIAPRSGLTVKHGLTIGAGVIDKDYTGELKVILFNHDQKAFMVRPGYRIAQLILERCETPNVEVVEDLEETERGDEGFGSTGDNFKDMAHFC